MTDVREAAQNLIEYAIHRSMIGQDDRIWAYNTILECIGATGPALDMAWALQAEKLSLLHPDTLPNFDLEGTLAALSEAAVANGAAEDTASGRDRIAMRIMGVLMPRPSVVNEEFNGRMGVNEPRAATDWFYGLCCDAGYVRRAAIARNIKWSTPTNWGDLEITINLSKPEKDPRDIAAAGAAKNTGEKYPACQLCIENEGYPGRSAAADGGAHPARQNLRVIPIQLDGERWGFQYSPYAYFNEHCIAMSSEHRPMHVDRKSLSCLLDFVDLFPHYFIGSNADLPIVGGSILSHDHFQGGAHEFPMMHAAEVSQFSVPGFDQVIGTVLQWPLSVLRLRSHDRAQLLDATEKIILAWREWTDESVGVVAHTADGVAHNTVTPVIRVDSRGNAGGEIYEAYLALRCNITTDEHPLGVFHPHAEYHHIKKENIGLIEVMGLAILPPRLVPELGAVREHLLAAKADASYDLAGALEGDDLCRSHAAWAEDVFARREQAAAVVAAREGGDEAEKRAKRALDAAEKKLAHAADALDAVREKGAPRLSAEVSAQMSRLEMGSASLAVSQTRLPRDQWGSMGPSRVEFLYRPAAGLTARPLRRIASGGEVSRVMLACKVALGDADGCDTLVFDEVDAGVGGATAVALAQVLRDLGRTHQVIVVTHLAQVASWADAQFVVTKGASDGGQSAVTTTVAEVCGDAFLWCDAAAILLVCAGVWGVCRNFAGEKKRMDIAGTASAHIRTG